MDKIGFDTNTNYLYVNQTAVDHPVR
jgi:hypothetical protein